MADSLPQKPNSKFRKQSRQQTAFRQSFFQTLKVKYGLDMETRKDTLILVEYYDNICLGCSFNEIALLEGHTVYRIKEIDSKMHFSSNSVRMETVSFNTHSLVGDGIWKLLTKKNETNPFDPKLYSAPCLDGANANITWILPKLVCHSINANCIS